MAAVQSELKLIICLQKGGVRPVQMDRYAVYDGFLEQIRCD